MAKYVEEQENRNAVEGLQAEQILQLIKAIVMPEMPDVTQSEEPECEETKTEPETVPESEETFAPEGKRCYTVKEVQDMLGISRPTVYELLKKNEFRWLQIGNKYRISKRSFDAWLDQKMGSV